jgi:hypothetical protein
MEEAMGESAIRSERGRAFAERERGFEAKFARDEEFKFLVCARRDKLFAAWAADCLGHTGAARVDFIAAVLAVQGYPRHDEALLNYVGDAVKRAGGKPQADLAAELERCAERARDELLAGGEPPPDHSSRAPG